METSGGQVTSRVCPVAVADASTSALQSPGRSLDPLGHRHDDPLRAADVGHAPHVLVLADAADEAVALCRRLVHDGLEIVHLEGDVTQPELRRHRAGRSRLMVGPTKLDSSSFDPPPGGTNVRISEREPGMPMTVSTNSPSMNILPSTSKPSPTK